MTREQSTSTQASPRKGLGARRGMGFLALLAGVLAVCLTVGVGSASAAGAPSFADGSVVALGVTQTSAGPFRVGLQEAGARETKWSVEYALGELGPWSPVPGGSGSVPAGLQTFAAGGELTGLTPETTYYIRARAENGFEPAVEPVYGPALTEPPVKFETLPVRPEGGVCRFPKVTGVSANVVCHLRPDGFETSWRVEYATSQKALEEGAGTVVSKGTITLAEAEKDAQEEQEHETGGDDGYQTVEGQLAGLAPEKAYYATVFAENEHGVETKQPFTKFVTGGVPVVSTLAVHSLHGSLIRVLGVVQPHGDDTHIHFEYLPVGEFEANGFANAASTPERDVGSGEYEEGENVFPTYTFGGDLAGLVPGEAYAYRLVARSDLGTVDGSAQTLTDPEEAHAAISACANQYMRVGGEKTVDIGDYEYLAANADGSQLLLQEQGGGSYPVVLYQTETGTATALFTLTSPINRSTNLVVSRDFTAFLPAQPGAADPRRPAG